MTLIYLACLVGNANIYWLLILQVNANSTTSLHNVVNITYKWEIFFFIHISTDTEINKSIYIKHKLKLFLGLLAF